MVQVTFEFLNLEVDHSGMIFSLFLRENNIYYYVNYQLVIIGVWNFKKISGGTEQK